MDASDDTAALAELRVATPDDADTILRMMESFNRFEDIVFTPAGLRASYETLLAHPEWGAVFLAEVGGVPAGYAVLAYGFDFEYGGRDAFLCELFVVDRDRGKGIGRILVEHVEAYAKQQGVKALHLIVRQENGHAQVMYRRAGFKFDPRLLMSKPLD